MNNELITQIEQLLEFGYGDALRLDAIIDALRNGRPLYPSDQKYVDMLISKYLFPHEEEVQDLKNQINSLEMKIETMKEDYYGKKKKPIEKPPINHCTECGSIVSKTHNFCPKCGINQENPEDHTRYPGSRSYKKAGAAIAIIIVIIIVYGTMNLYALSSLQFRPNGTGTFDFADLSMPLHLQACNPSYFPASFDKFSLDINYKSTNFGDAIVWGKMIPPKSSVPVDGQLKLNGQGLVQLFLASFASAFSGQQSSFDPSQMRITATLDAPIFGVIPFSISKDYSIGDFKGMMSNATGQYSC